jgi:hypothetical protein
MRYFIPFYVIVAFSSSVFVFSCTKNEADITNTWGEILMRHKWKHYQTRSVTIDTATNTVIKDTLYQVEACYQNSLYVFATDGIVKRNFLCFSPTSDSEGRWFLNTDSTFAATILIRTSYGTGSVLTDFGLPYGKMKLLTETDFQLTSFSSSFSYGSTNGYATYYLKADN